MDSQQGYSSVVKIVLKVGSTSFDVAQVSDDLLILRDNPGFDISGNAELVISVDGVETECHVELRMPTTENRVLAYSR